MNVHISEIGVSLFQLSNVLQTDETVSNQDDYLRMSDMMSAACVNRVVGLACKGSKCNRQACCLLKSVCLSCVKMFRTETMWKKQNKQKKRGLAEFRESQRPEGEWEIEEK